MPQLLTSATATGVPTVWGGAAGQFEASAATWSGATVSLQRKNADGTFTDVAGTLLTATGRVAFSLQPCTIRAAVTGGPPTSVTAAAWRVRNG